MLNPVPIPMQFSTKYRLRSSFVTPTIVSLIQAPINPDIMVDKLYVPARNANTVASTFFGITLVKTIIKGIKTKIMLSEVIIVSVK